MLAATSPHAETVNRIFIEGPIGEWPNTAAGLRERLPEGGGAVEVHINSPGGSAFEGVAMYHALAQYDGAVTTVCTALAASAASVVFLAGEKRVVRQGALVMVHRPMAVTVGEADAHRKSASDLDKLGDEVAKLYAAVTKQPMSTVIELMAAETWMGADEAIRLGFATDADDEAGGNPPRWNYEAYLHAPRALMGFTTKERAMTDVSSPDVHARITERCVTARLSADETAQVIASANDDERRAKDIIIDMIAARDPQDAPLARGGADAPLSPISDAQRAAMIDGIAARMGAGPPSSDGREFAGMSCLNIGRIVLEAQGQRTHLMSDSDLAGAMMSGSGMHSTSDFSGLLGAAAHKVLMSGYDPAESDMLKLARKRTVTKLDDIKIVRLSEMPAMELLPEGGEFKFGTRTEETATYRAETFGRMFSLSRNAIVNDDLQGFADTLREFGRSAAQLKAQVLASLFAENSGDGPLMDDGDPVFHADRGNLAEIGAVLSVDSVSAARRAIRNTKGLDGATPLALRPKYLLVSSDLETDAEKLLAEINATTVDDVNPFARRLELLVEPRLAEQSWYLFADPANAPCLEVAHLHGREAPHLEQRDGWDVLGVEFRAFIDFGAAFIGWRGAYRNPGSAPG